jgi:hypothetical protein
MTSVLQALTALLSQQWLWGAIVGGSIAYVTQRLNFRHSLGEQRRVAAMQIASQIRVWLIETNRVFEDPARYEPDPNSDPNDPYGYYFPTPSDIPAFPFAAAPERISVLDNANAQSLFDLFERRMIAESKARVAADTHDFEYAATIFEPRIAQVYLDCLAVYSKLAKQVGWTGDVLSKTTIEEMRQRAAQPHDTGYLGTDLGLEIPSAPKARQAE